MRFLIILLLIIISSNNNANAQIFSSEGERKDVEAILTIAINNVAFDDIYKRCKVYFSANELLTESSSLILKRGKCKAKVLDKSKIRNKSHVVLGDFTTDWDDMQAARVMFYMFPQNKILGIRLVKKNGVWTIYNHIVMDY